MLYKSLLAAILISAITPPPFHHLLAREYGPDQGRTTVSSADGNYRASAIFVGGRGDNMHFRVCSRSNICFTTMAQYDTPNDVKAGLFSPDSKYFAAAYHYGHKGSYTWIGIWSLPDGRLTNSVQQSGWIRDLSFVFAASQRPPGTQHPQDSECGRSCPWPGGFDDRLCASEADVCACRRDLESAMEELKRLQSDDCRHPLTGTLVKECLDSQRSEYAFISGKVQRRTARLERCRQEAGVR